jgi:thymidylate kinase
MKDVEPLLGAAFRALDESGVLWCLLRGREALAAPTGDVDLLIHPRDVATARRAVVDAGFSCLRVWARGSQNFFLGYNRTTDRWPYIHAMTGLDFGDHYGLRLKGTVGVLARRVFMKGIPMPAADDGFWITLLHALLDKGMIRQKHRLALSALVDRARADGELGCFVDRIAPADARAAILLDRVRSEDWGAIETAGRAILAGWRRRDRAVRMRAVCNRTALFAQKLSESITRRGINIALLAPDGAGKSTLARALTGALHFPARCFYMGLEGGPFAGGGPSRFPGCGFVRRVAFLWRNYLQARYHQARRRVVIFDRYPYEALLPAPVDATRLQRVRRWLLGHALPAPDVVVVLDAPGEVLHARKAEHTPEHLERERHAYRELAHRMGRGIVLNAARPADEVRRDATEAFWRAYRRRYLKR